MVASIQFEKIALRIIKKQESIIGPLAWVKAEKVVGLNVNQSRDSIAFTGNEGNIINALVIQYVRLFGRVALEVSKESVQDLLEIMPAEEIPSIFKKNVPFNENIKIPEMLYKKNLQVAARLKETQKNLKIEKVNHRDFVDKTDKVIREIEKELRR